MNGFVEREWRKIAVFRALQLGDLLCAIPAVRSLKAALPNAKITLIGLPWAEKFVKRYSNYFSGFIKFPGYPGLPEQPFHLDEYLHFIEEVKSHDFDLLIQMHGDGSIVNPMIDVLELPNTAGYCKSGDYCEDREGYMLYPEGLPEIERHLLLMKYLGVPVKGKHLELPIYSHEEDAWSFLKKTNKLKKNEYIVIHAGARDTKRWWEPEKFARVADKIAHKGYKIVLTGTEAEKKTTRMVEEHMEFPAINLVGKTDLGTMAALVRDSKMVLSNDTGVSHIAAAVETPSIIIFLSSDPQRWAPLNRHLHRVIHPQDSDNTKMVFKMAEKILMDEANEEEYDMTLSVD